MFIKQYVCVCLVLMYDVRNEELENVVCVDAADEVDDEAPVQNVGVKKVFPIKPIKDYLK